MVWRIILAFFSLLLIIEGLVVVLFPKETRRITSRIIKNKKTLKTVAIIEIVIGVALLLLTTRFL